MAAPARIGLDDALERHLAGVHQLAVFADLSLHVVDALGPHLSDHLSGVREVCVEAEEVDAIFQREDLRLSVQPQAERYDVLLDFLEDLPEQQLVVANNVEVIHISAIYEAEVVAQPVVEVVEIEQRKELAALVADRDARIRRTVNNKPQKPLDEQVGDDARRLCQRDRDVPVGVHGLALEALERRVPDAGGECDAIQIHKSDLEGVGRDVAENSIP